MVGAGDGPAGHSNSSSTSALASEVQSPSSLSRSLSDGSDDVLEPRRSTASSLHASRMNSRVSLLSSRQPSSLFSSRFGSRNGYLQVDDLGVHLSIVASKVLVCIVAAIGIILLTLVVTFALRLGKCHKKPLLTSCASFFLNRETNNLQGYRLPPECNGFVARYVDSGQYHVDFAVAVEAARQYLSTLEVHHDGRDLVVLDIDETSLSNIPYYKAHNYGVEAWNVWSWSIWVNSAIAPALDPMLSLYTDLRARNWSVAFITGRSESMGPRTALNLYNAGYTGWTTLILRTKEEEKLTAVQYKSKYRRMLANEGYRIRSSLGDQWSDLLGGNTGERTFKMPNPMYYIH